MQRSGSTQLAYAGCLRKHALLGLFGFCTVPHVLCTLCNPVQPCARAILVALIESGKGIYATMYMAT